MFVPVLWAGRYESKPMDSKPNINAITKESKCRVMKGLSPNFTTLLDKWCPIYSVGESYELSAKFYIPLFFVSILVSPIPEKIAAIAKPKTIARGTLSS